MYRYTGRTLQDANYFHQSNGALRGTTWERQYKFFITSWCLLGGRIGFQEFSIRVSKRTFSFFSPSVPCYGPAGERIWCTTGNIGWIHVLKLGVQARGSSEVGHVHIATVILTIQICSYFPFPFEARIYIGCPLQFFGELSVRMRFSCGPSAAPNDGCVAVYTCS